MDLNRYRKIFAEVDVNGRIGRSPSFPVERIPGLLEEQTTAGGVVTTHYTTRNVSTLLLIWQETGTAIDLGVFGTNVMDGYRINTDDAGYCFINFHKAEDDARSKVASRRTLFGASGFWQLNMRVRIKGET